MTTTGRTTEAATRSIIAELPGSEPSSVVMLGAHLDSVLDGPGLNDDGSGVAALLAIARALQGTRPRATVRLAFWSGEELGLLGSSHYVAGLTDAERAAVVAYLNADMIGSPNGYAGVYHETDAPPGSAALGALLDAAVERAGGVPVDVTIGASSDHVAFGQAGIPIGGLFSGASEAVTTAQATSSGATAGQPADACYHQACDGLENVDLGLARQLTTALADVAVRLADTPELLVSVIHGDLRWRRRVMPVEREPAQLVAQPLVVEHEFPDLVGELGALPLALQAAGRLALVSGAAARAALIA